MAIIDFKATKCRHCYKCVRNCEVKGYKARERIHRAVADARLLANPASRSRVADFDPN